MNSRVVSALFWPKKKNTTIVSIFVCTPALNIMAYACLLPIFPQSYVQVGYNDLQTMPMRLTYFQCPIGPIHLRTYSPKVDTKTYIQYAATYGKIYTGGEPTGL